MADNAASEPKERLSLNVSYRLVSIVLLAIVLGMLALWRPWEGSVSADTQTIRVTGEAKLSAEPDEFVFNPAYEFEGDKIADVTKMATAKSDEVIKKLKELGVEDKNLKSTASSGSGRPYIYHPSSGKAVFTLYLTITVSGRDNAQKIQDYLVTTNSSGAISPQPNFSDAKRKKLESQAREQASIEARAKADQSAKNLGFKIGKVKSVEDGAGFGVTPLAGIAEDSIMSSGAKLGVQPGQNDLHYSVTVTYFVR